MGRGGDRPDRRSRPFGRRRAARSRPRRPEPRGQPPLNQGNGQELVFKSINVELTGKTFRAAGPELLAECRALGGCPTDEAKTTKGYRLKARHVIHTVGPVWSGGERGEAELLASCYRRSLEEAARLGARSVAFPAISCGVYRFPPEQAARIAVAEIGTFLSAHDRPEKVLLVAFDAKMAEILRSANRTQGV